MFSKVFGDLTIEVVTAEKRGMCLMATYKGKTNILMDFCGMNPMLVPDGTNVYFFGNKLIVVTRWSDMTDDEKRCVEEGELTLAIHPYKCAQFSLKTELGWNDVSVTLPHCFSELNDENKQVDKALFIFADTHDAEYLYCRPVELSDSIGSFLCHANRFSHQIAALDGSLDLIRSKAENDPQRDFWDYLYDACWDLTAAFSRKARQTDPERIPGGIYIDIDSDNKITNVYQRPIGQQTAEAPKEEPVTEPEENAGIIAAPEEEMTKTEEERIDPETASMSDETKLYYELANKGVAEAQFNLGVCYENGSGVESNPEKAFFWYRKAAEQGHIKAQYNLGVCYYNGIGTEKDADEAVKLFRSAAEQGDMSAQYNMGVCCYQGIGVPADTHEAIEWFRKSAEQGYPNARKILKMDQ